MTRKKAMKNDLIIEEEKKAVYFSYLDYTLIPASSVYDYYAGVPHHKDRAWLDQEDLKASRKRPIKEGLQEQKAI